MVESEQHIKSIRLMNLSGDGAVEVTKEEDTHLQECEECKQAVAVFSLLFG